MFTLEKRHPVVTDFQIGPLHNHRACIIGFAGKGPVGVPTYVSSPQQLYHFYGPAVPGLPMVLVAEQILTLNQSLLMVRVAGPHAQTASVEIPCASDYLLMAEKPGPYKLSRNSFFRWACDDVVSPDILVALKGEVTASDLAQQLNEQVGESGLHFTTEKERLAIWCRGRIELVGVQDSIYQALGLEHLLKPAELSNEPLTEVELIDAHNLLVVVGGTGNLTIDNVTQTVSFNSLAGRRCSMIEVANCINSQAAKRLPGGFEAIISGECLTLRTLHGGKNAVITLKPASTARQALGFLQLSATGASVETASVREIGNSLTIQAESPGSVGNAVKVKIESNQDESFNLKVYHDNALVESWTNLNKLPESKLYVGTFVNLVSNWIRVTDNVEKAQPPRPGMYQLGKLLKGSNAVTHRQELYAESLANLGEYDIDLIAIPGEDSVEAVNLLTQFCDDRGDCLAVIDSPKDIGYTDALRWKRSLNETENAAAFWPWVKVWDAKNRTEVAIPPSGSAIATLTRCDLVSCVWNSASGLGRGIVPGILEVSQHVRHSERNIIRGDPDLNAIVKKDGVFFIQSEATLTGGKISLKRLVFLLKKLIRRGIDSLLRDCIVTDDYFTENFILICDQILKQIKLRQGIQHYHIKAGDEINTPEVKAKGGFRARIGVQPSNTSLWVSFDFSTDDTGVAENKVFVTQNRRS